MAEMDDHWPMEALAGSCCRFSDSPTDEWALSDRSRHTLFIENERIISEALPFVEKKAEFLGKCGESSESNW